MASRAAAPRAAGRVAGVVRQVLGAGDVRPLHVGPGWPRDPQSRLVVVPHRRLPQLRLDRFCDRLEVLCALAHHLDQRPDREGRAEQVSQHIPCAGVGHERLLHQVGGHRAQPRAILARGTHPSRRRRLRRHPARRAAHMADLMLGNGQAHRRQLVDLAPLDPPRRVVRQCLLASRTVLGAVHHDRVGRLRQPYLMARVPWLATGLLAALLPQTPRLARESVTRRRLGAVVAVFGQLAPQLLHLGQQSPHLLTQGGVLRFQLGNAFLWRHAISLPDRATPS